MDDLSLLGIAWLSSTGIFILTVLYLLCKIRKLHMAASDNLNAALTALETAANALTPAVDAYVAKAAAAPTGTPDAVVQSAADKIFNIAAGLQQEIAKIQPPAA